MDNLKKDNHYVSQFYLKNFSFNGKEVYVYRTLVSHEKVPVWNKQSIKSIGKQPHLYTQIVHGEESDEIEDYFERKYETPVQEAYYKAINDKKLNSIDWNNLIKFIASQILRTPSAFINHMELMDKIVPNTLENTANKISSKLKDNTFGINTAYEEDKKYAFFKENFPFNIEIDEENKTVKVGAIIGRKSWLVSAQHVLMRLTPVLLSHKWSIVNVHKDIELFTSDDPIICLNYYDRGKYDFKGGWGNLNSEIIFPISPSKFVYTKVGNKKIKSKSYLNYEMSEMIKSFIAKHSYRYIYSKTEQKYMKKYRERIIDEVIYKNESEAWKNWHKEQSKM